MKTYLIPIHSVVDVITNSSSVIYTEAHGKSIELAKKIINNVLITAGSDKTADDLFDFKVQAYPNDVCEYISNHLDDDPEFESKIPDLDGFKAADNASTVGGKPDYAARRSALAAWEVANKNKLAALFESVSPDVEAGLPSVLIVATKDGVDTNFADLAISMFSIEASYDG